jgi:hypothetical protein
MPTKSDEIRVRRILERRGLRLERCRRRDPAAKGFGLYRVVTKEGVPLTYAGYTLTLERAVAWCRRTQRSRRASVTPSGKPLPPEPPPVTLLMGDALRVLRGFPDRSFACCVTSPPYWQQRDYGEAVDRRGIGTPLAG